MFILPPVHELTIVGVHDAGVPNRERIVLRPTEPLNLAAFALLLSLRNPDGTIVPIPDQFFWLGERWLAPPAWIVVFTGPGAYREGAHETSGAPVIELHWGRSAVVLDTPNVVVSLVRLAGLNSFEPPPPASLQHPSRESLPTNPRR
ncbi:MAG: hypothetical protein IPK33_03335 [Gemmatimonadetes bacterium]|nr:hypothetical protein [Gemmatimonadota bacterium]MBK8056935.1 hypothetical protein [Gemmatimonadota bacterium]